MILHGVLPQLHRKEQFAYESGNVRGRNDEEVRVTLDP